MTAMTDWITETDIEGTIFDPEYLLAQATHIGLWYWAHETYWDWVASNEKDGPIAEPAPDNSKRFSRYGL